MTTLTEKEIMAMQPLPPQEMQDMVQRRFAEAFRERRASLPPMARNRGIILDMLENNPVWGKWGQIGSYTAARNVLNRYWPEWNNNQNEESDE